ncbi:nitrate reductase [Selenomonas sp. oral taxon 136]|nr:nitrate reductase [Selenomonas sp. oral taxon 136]
MAMGGGVCMSVIAFFLSILAGVIANCISKWLDERDDGDEPRR